MELGLQEMKKNTHLRPWSSLRVSSSWLLFLLSIIVLVLPLIMKEILRGRHIYVILPWNLYILFEMTKGKSECVVKVSA